MRRTIYQGLSRLPNICSSSGALRTSRPRGIGRLTVHVTTKGGTIPRNALGSMTGILICLLYVPVLAGEVASRPVEEMREALFTGLALRPGMVVADIGIGGGWFTSRAAVRGP